MKLLLWFLLTFVSCLAVTPSPTYWPYRSGSCADVLYMIDTSASISDAQLEIVKEFFCKVTNFSYDALGPIHAPRIASVGFDTFTKVYFPFATRTRSEALSLMMGVDRVTSFGSTNTAGGFDLANSSVWNSSLADITIPYNRIQLVFTDGRPSQYQHVCYFTPPDPATPTILTADNPIRPSAKRMLDDGIVTFVIGVGEDLSKAKMDAEFNCTAPFNRDDPRLDTIVDAELYKDQHNLVFWAPDFDSLDNLTVPLADYLSVLCLPPPTKAPTTPYPTRYPSTSPSKQPTQTPTGGPTIAPSTAPSIAPTIGDPHITTLDGLRYTFNGVGDHYMAKSTDNKLEVQLRTHIVSNTSAAVTGIAMRWKTTSIVALWNGSDSEEILVGYNGRQFTDSNPIVNTPELQTRDNRGGVGDNVYEIKLVKSGVTMKLAYGGRSSFQLDFPPAYRGQISGLLGDFDSDPLNDLKRPDGTVVSPQASNKEIHYGFGRLWSVPDFQSLFTPFDFIYREVKDAFSPGFEPLFEARFADAEFERRAMLLCGEDAQCLYDAAATMDLDYAAFTKLDNEIASRDRLAAVVDAGSTAAILRRSRTGMEKVEL